MTKLLQYMSLALKMNKSAPKIIYFYNKVKSKSLIHSHSHVTQKYDHNQIPELIKTGKTSKKRIKPLFQVWKFLKMSVEDKISVLIRILNLHRLISQVLYQEWREDSQICDRKKLRSQKSNFEKNWKQSHENPSLKRCLKQLKIIPLRCYHTFPLKFWFAKTHTFSGSKIYLKTWFSEYPIKIHFCHF